MLGVRRLSLALLVFPAATLAYADFTVSHSTLSAVQEMGTLSGTQTRYDSSFFFDHEGTDLYVNQFVLNPGSNWDPDIDFTIPTTGFFHTGGFYQLGTAITGDANWFIFGLIQRWGTVTDVDEGLYDFTVDVLGGDSDTAGDVIDTLELQLEVVNSIDISVSGAATAPTIYAGQQSTVMMTVTNNMDRNFVSTTWYYTNGGMINGSNTLPIVSFTGDWFGKEIAPSDSRTDGHTTWTANAGTPLGTYTGWMGVYGGMYDGDFHYQDMNPAPTIEVVVVPEPATMAVLGLGAAALIRRRRK